jgi:prephenate dehydrogenase
MGAGLIGTSVGLALAGAAEVVLSDVSEQHLAEAVARGAGRRWDGSESADVALVCAPPSLTAQLAVGAVATNLATTVSHVASHQSGVQAEVEALATVDVSRVCGGHPLAGRERSGPGAATARLFVDRPWVVCPSPRTSSDAERAVVRLAEACGAVPVRASAQDHDAAVALVSHLPQVAASALAARLLSADDSALDPTRLAGPGVQDTTRIAASDPDLWVEVLTRNAEHVAPLVRALSEDLARVADALEAVRGEGSAPTPSARVVPANVLRDLLDRGRAGRGRLPFKQGRAESSVEAFAEVVVSVPDRPGQLAAVLVAAGDAGVNVEDVHVEHLPGRARGLVELLVPTADADRARRSLAQAGWDVLSPG